jgi:hypothetical protein
VAEQAMVHGEGLAAHRLLANFYGLFIRQLAESTTLFITPHTRLTL